MIKTLKIMLIPNNKQKSKLFQLAGVARFAYNWALGREQENYKNGGSFLSDYDLRKEFTKLKSKKEYKWLNDYSNNITKQAIKDACLAYKRFFKGQSAFPKFKSKRKSKPSFYMDTDKIQFTDKTVRLEKITLSRKKNKQKLNWIRLAERNRIPTDSKYINPRITFDGISWWISVGIEYADNTQTPVNDGVGIDLGIKDLAICSDIDKPYKNINKTQKIRKLKKKKRRLQRKISRKYLINKKGDSYCKTSNIIKAEKKLLKLNHRLTDIRHNYLHQTTTEIINRKPKFIVLEDLNVKGMMKNKQLSEVVAEQCFYEFYRQIEYKSLWNNIKFIIADRFYASSKICSCCGAVKKDLKLSDRIYKCDNCNAVIDRDKNASINLYNYGKSIA
ncbi:RNA-guided endonuclease InsQ/TnpB family protein [Clostridium neonatale]|uniref:RNA-guided endonuclease InsQ/TnpB family protein n=1 Tax=Clostridium neonatale TaxID=137838 RepID=UPI00133055EB|nr:RNA-guided endonuclease TnpB family protein [Clostridium neonatale]